MATSALAQSAGALHVHLDGFRSNNGQAYCSIYNDATAFPSHGEKAVKLGKAATIKDASATINFDSLAPGKYAAVCYHDENSNGKFDENALGMPKEGYGFSNNPNTTFGPASFKEASFTYSGGDLPLMVKVSY